jgi:hypothetical protein
LTNHFVAVGGRVRALPSRETLRFGLYFVLLLATISNKIAIKKFGVVLEKWG